jgi:Cu/Ag efflux pump CusA
VIEASELRLRPILMTTGAMVLGTIPLALASGAGAESRQQIGWVIVGGLLLGTFFTLFVVPTVYTSGLFCTPEERGWSHCRLTNSRTIISSPMTSGRRRVHHA